MVPEQKDEMEEKTRRGYGDGETKTRGNEVGRKRRRREGFQCSKTLQKGTRGTLRQSTAASYSDIASNLADVCHITRLALRLGFETDFPRRVICYNYRNTLWPFKSPASKAALLSVSPPKACGRYPWVSQSGIDFYDSWPTRRRFQDWTELILFVYIGRCLWMSFVRAAITKDYYFSIKPLLPLFNEDVYIKV